MDSNSQVIPKEIKVISYNIRWRGGKDLEKLTNFLKSDSQIGQPDIICLQEVDRNKKRTDNVNTVQLIAKELKWNYVWAAPPPPKATDEEETGVAILSSYPLSDVVAMVLPNPGPGGKRRSGIGATITIGQNVIRVYTMHAATRISSDKRQGQFQYVLDDLVQYPNISKIMIMGDFNTLTDGDDCTKFFEHNGFITAIPNDKTTFHWKIIMLKLDWLWVRSMTVLGGGIYRKIGVSDHYPLWTKVKLDD